MPSFDSDAVRRQFPALTQAIAGQLAIFLDNPCGTQVPQDVWWRANRCSKNLGRVLVSAQTEQVIGDKLSRLEA